MFQNENMYEAPHITAIRRSDKLQRLRVCLKGAVQGVGFRPFVYRLAMDLGLTGWVSNSNEGVSIEVEGGRELLDRFILRLESEKPPLSHIQSLEPLFLDPAGYGDFSIRPSSESGLKTALVLPDIATCPDCLREIFDISDRRYLYPFTNCTHCGPRYSIINSLPYDRPQTSMRDFEMCDRCRAEYENPLDRRFHAQPTACPDCGPQLELWDVSGRILERRHNALLAAAEAVREGKIVAVKGLGGFHLMVDAGNVASVEELRRRKGREEKPFALMYPSPEVLAEDCEVSAPESRLLRSPECPIVLLHRREKGGSGRVSASVAPGNPWLGAMLPYTPLHHILMRELGFPVVATSGNLSDEPICTEEREALLRLGRIADLFLVHNRPIMRGVDDSIVRMTMGRELVLRRARGYAPLPVKCKSCEGTVMAVGGHLKNTVALRLNGGVFLSQHLGDLETSAAWKGFREAQESLQKLYGTKPQIMVCDLHPDYLSTKYAEKSGVKLKKIQHHRAHILSCMAENELEGPVLGVSWDGTGYGPDSTVWGGEFLVVEGDSFRRAGHLRTFPLPGGDKAAQEPRRSAMGLLYEIYGGDVFNWDFLPPVRSFPQEDLHNLIKMLSQGINTARTSSAGRLFDAAASILGLRQVSSYEGAAAMELEHLTDGVSTGEYYIFRIIESDSAIVVDWEPMILELFSDVISGLSEGLISARFHNGLAEAIVETAILVGEPKVVLSGGCFQNCYLTERTVSRLREEGFQPYWHQRVPPNDGGLALGQAFSVR